jgi:N-acetylneuraminic acid mutarotase
VELTKGKWEERKSMTIPRSETAAVVIGGLIYVPGGYGDEPALGSDRRRTSGRSSKPCPMAVTT